MKNHNFQIFRDNRIPGSADIQCYHNSELGGLIAAIRHLELICNIYNICNIYHCTIDTRV